MSSPFISVHVQPSYGKNKAIITWHVQPGYSAGDFYVYKSFNKGLPPWELLNETPVKGAMFEDTNLDLDSSPYYRLLLVLDGAEIDGPVVSPFDKLSKIQYGGVSKMMRLEYMRMSTGNGIQVLHYIPLSKGELNDSIDPLTDQRFKAACDNDTEDFGYRFKGGFSAPVYTWMEIAQYGKHVNEEREGGIAMNNTLIHGARLLAFPRPAPGDLIIHPDTDRRYGIMSPVQGNYFRGVFPISYDVQLQLLNVTDARYDIPIPAVLPKPLWAKYE